MPDLKHNTTAISYELWYCKVIFISEILYCHGY